MKLRIFLHYEKHTDRLITKTNNSDSVIDLYEIIFSVYVLYISVFLISMYILLLHNSV